MPTPLKIAVSLLLPLAAVLLVVLLWPSGPERQIRGALDEIADALEKSGTETQFEALGKARRIAGHFVDGCRVEYQPGRSASGDRREIAGAVIKARDSLTRLAVTVESHAVELAGDGERAQSIARVSVRGADSGGPDAGRNRYRIEWVRQDSDWLIEGVEIVEPE